MHRKFKTIGLTAISILAVCAVTATAAQAEGEFTASQYPATIEGQGAGGKAYVLQFGTHIVNCPNITFKNTVKSNSKSATQAPTFTVLKNCSWVFLGLKQPAEVTMNGCDWVFPDAAKNSKDLKCKEKPVEIHGYESMKAQEESKTLCTYDIAEQSNGTVSFENKAGPPQDILVKENITSIVYTATGSKLVCGSSGSNGEFIGETTLTAKNEAGESINYMIG